MSNIFLGQITMVSFGFPPKGWAFCNGQLLPINQNQALFSLLGTQYGGNGQTNFALPNLQSQLAVHQGQGSGLSSYVIGQSGGASTVTLDQTTTPQHSHTFNVTTFSASAATIASNLLPAKPTVASGAFYAASQPLPAPALQPQTLAATACGTAGGSQPHTNLMPLLCLTFIIALQGVFPSRN
jgi:microcystin-dependent protein